MDDCGPGVPLEFRSRLFQRYARAPGQRVTGTGIGLYVVKSLVEAQLGRAWYQTGPDGGARFCFSLPLAPEDGRRP